MNFAILGSGRGSNARALLQAWQDGILDRAVPVALFSDQAEAPILGLGPEFGIPSSYLSPGRFRTRLSEEAERDWIQAVRASGADLVVLAGFMRVLHAPFLDAFSGRLINLHPSLLPSFKGLDAIGQALSYGVKVTGCTVHYVTGEVDGGPILDQSAVRVLPGDTVQSLSARVHAAEHILLPSVVARLSRGFRPGLTL